MKVRVRDLDALGIAMVRAAINAQAMEVESIEGKTLGEVLGKLMQMHPEAWKLRVTLSELVHKVCTGGNFDDQRSAG